MESVEVTNEKTSERISDENAQGLDKEENSGTMHIETVKIVGIQFTRKDARFAKKADLLKEHERSGIVCVKENYPNSYLNTNDIWENVEAFFSKLHERGGANPHSADFLTKKGRKSTRCEN